MKPTAPTAATPGTHVKAETPSLFDRFLDPVEWRRLSKRDLLAVASLHMFDAGALLDCASDLSQLNMTYGLAKIHYVQKLLGYCMPYASVIWSPDRTITKNAERWQAGFGYGGKITWGTGDDKIVFLEGMPNACGMIAVGLDTLPTLSTLFDRVNRLLSRTTVVAGKTVSWDFGKGNHFVDVFRVEPLVPELDLPEHIGIIHMGCDNQKSEVYWFLFDQAKAKQVEEFETPFGNTFVLTGTAARQYYQSYLNVEHYANEKRRLAAREIFSSENIISESVHQGLLDMNNLVLGSNHFIAEDVQKLYPITLRSDLPAFLVYPEPNLSPETIEGLGLAERAWMTRCYERLLSANIFPHGGGYQLLHKSRVTGVDSVNGYRLFKLQNEGYRGEEVVAHMKGIDTDYRGIQVADAAFAGRLCRPAAMLHPVYTIRA